MLIPQPASCNSYSMQRPVSRGDRGADLSAACRYTPAYQPPSFLAIDSSGCARQASNRVEVLQFVGCFDSTTHFRKLFERVCKSGGDGPRARERLPVPSHLMPRMQVGHISGWESIVLEAKCYPAHPILRRPCRIVSNILAPRFHSALARGRREALALLSPAQLLQALPSPLTPSQACAVWLPPSHVTSRL
jgi:hypothetical protein